MQTNLEVKCEVEKPLLKEVNKNWGIAEGVLEDMAFYLFGNRISKLTGQFSYICTQEDEYSMCSFAPREVKVPSLPGGRATRKR